jgi:DNA-binding transcriptional regulator YhcF (GntR family)
MPAGQIVVAALAREYPYVRSKASFGKRVSVPENNEQGHTEEEERLKRSIDAFIRAKIEQGYSRDEIIKMGRKIIKRRFFKVIR